MVGRLGHRGSLSEFFVVGWLGSATHSTGAVRDLVRSAQEKYDPALITTYVSSGHPLRGRLLGAGFLPTRSRIPCLARGLVNPRGWISARWALESTEKDTH